MSIGALHISRCLWRITTGQSLPESLLETGTAAYLFTPRVLVCFCLLALGPSSVGPLGPSVLCTVHFAAPALARASATFATLLYTNLSCPYTWVTVKCVCVCVCDTQSFNKVHYHTCVCVCVCKCNPYNIAVDTCHTWTSFHGQTWYNEGHIHPHHHPQHLHHPCPPV